MDMAIESVGKTTGKAPAVSVIIPNYNYARYLEARIESVLGQTFTDFELILLDDASTDGSAGILSRYKDNPHVSHICINTKNTGSPFRQWMKGISLARSEWVWVAEADDLATPDFLECCMSYIRKYENVVVCMAGSNYIDEDGNVITEKADYWKDDTRQTDHLYDGRFYVEHKLYWNNCIMNASGVLFNRECAMRLPQEAFIDMRYSGDWMFWFLMAMQGNVLEVRRALNYFRQHTAKVSEEGISTGKRLYEDIDVVTAMEKALMPHLGRYKRRLLHGMIYRRITKLKDSGKRDPLFAYIADRLGGGASDLRLFHLNQYLRYVCPFLPTMKRDRRKPGPCPNA